MTKICYYCRTSITDDQGNVDIRKYDNLKDKLDDHFQARGETMGECNPPCARDKICPFKQRI